MPRRRIDDLKTSLLDLKGKRSDDLAKLQSRAEEAEEALAKDRQRAEDELLSAVERGEEAFRRGEEHVKRRMEELWALEEEYRAALKRKREDNLAFIRRCQEVSREMRVDIEGSNK